MDAQQHVLVVNPWPSSETVIDDIQDMYFGETAVYVAAIAAVSFAALLIRSLGGR